MTDPVDRHLEERLHALARGVAVPVTPAGEDVRRGRRRLLRMRLALAGGTTATLAVVLGVTGLTAGNPTASEPPIAGTSSPSLPADPTTSPSEEDGTTAPPKGDDAGNVGGQDPPGSPTGSASSETVGSTTREHERPGSANSVPAGTSGSQAHGDATVGPAHGHQSDLDPTSAPTSSVPTPTVVPTAVVTPTPEAPPTVPPVDTRIRLQKVLRTYNEVLAEHLDPARDHLQPYDRATDTKDTSKSGGRLFALGSTYRWEDGAALGGLQITVASGWDQVDWDCGASYSDWECHVPPATGQGEVATHDGVRQVAVEHADGQVVVLTSDPTHDADSRAVSGIESDEEELVAAAADDRLTLPGEAPVSPPRLVGDTFASAGAAALVGADETFTQTSIDRVPEVRGSWSVADVARGTLSWSARPVYSGAGWQCATSYRSCTEVVVDELGHTVHVANIKKRLGGGWVLEYDGPAYAVRVYASDQKFPKKRAYAFLTDEGWQPTT